MSQAKTKNKSWPVVGTLRRGESKKDGSKYSYIKLADNVTILVDGVEVPMNDKRIVRLEDPREKVKGLFDRGIISEADHDKRLETLANNDWLKYELVIAPPRT